MADRFPLYLLQLEKCSIFRQLQIEEALLRLTDDNWCVINTGAPPAVVFGISGKPINHLKLSKIEASPLPLIRRYSGGGTVVVDENTLFVSFILQKKDFPVACYPEPILRWSETLYREAFDLPEFHLRENDYVIESLKCGGNAQYIQKKRFVHHTTFLWDYAKEKMDCLLIPQKAPSYRQGRSHSDFLCCLKDFFSSKREVISSILSALKRRYFLKERCFPSHLLDREHRRSTKHIEYE